MWGCIGNWIQDFHFLVTRTPSGTCSLLGIRVPAFQSTRLPLTFFEAHSSLNTLTRFQLWNWPFYYHVLLTKLATVWQPENYQLHMVLAFFPYMEGIFVTTHNIWHHHVLGLMRPAPASAATNAFSSERSALMDKVLIICTWTILSVRLASIIIWSDGW